MTSAGIRRYPKYETGGSNLSLVSFAANDRLVLLKAQRRIDDERAEHRDTKTPRCDIKERLFMTKLLILSSDTGEGHNSAAAAIGNAGQSAGFQVSIRKPL